MSNTTHRKRIARAFAAASGRGYQDALRVVDAAIAAGRIKPPFDEDGIAKAVEALTSVDVAVEVPTTPRKGKTVVDTATRTRRVMRPTMAAYRGKRLASASLTEEHLMRGIAVVGSTEEHTFNGLLSAFDAGQTLWKQKGRGRTVILTTDDADAEEWAQMCEERGIAYALVDPWDIDPLGVSGSTEAAPVLAKRFVNQVDPIIHDSVGYDQNAARLLHAALAVAIALESEEHDLRLVLEGGRSSGPVLRMATGLLEEGATAEGEMWDWMRQRFAQGGHTEALAAVADELSMLTSSAAAVLLRDTWTTAARVAEVLAPLDEYFTVDTLDTWEQLFKQQPGATVILVRSPRETTDQVEARAISAALLVSLRRLIHAQYRTGLETQVLVSEATDCADRHMLTFDKALGQRLPYWAGLALATRWPEKLGLESLYRLGAFAGTLVAAAIVDDEAAEMVAQVVSLDRLFVRREHLRANNDRLPYIRTIVEDTGGLDVVEAVND